MDPDAYLGLLKAALTRSEQFEPPVPLKATNWKRHLIGPSQALLRRYGYQIVKSTAHRGGAGETIIGPQRLDSLRTAIEAILADGIRGDLIEAGVWRGGAGIFMRAVLASYDVTDRMVWLADSFQGFPSQQGIDAGVDFSGDATYADFAVGVDEVRANFARYNLLDDNVRFLEGWFADTLPSAPFEHLAIVRLDGDLYESTRDAISALYPRLSHGGFCFIDDYGAFDQCRLAVEEYRDAHGITESIVHVDSHCVYWRKDRVSKAR
jgi:O-methyltransferase